MIGVEQTRRASSDQIEVERQQPIAGANLHARGDMQVKSLAIHRNRVDAKMQKNFGTVGRTNRHRMLPERLS